MVQNKIWILAIFVLYCFASNEVLAQELHRYICQADRVDISVFESGRKFDKRGIILSEGKYHPLSISRFGLLAYYRFLDTSDSIYYLKCINQVQYFKDTSKVNVIFNGKGIGLPYNFNYHGLKAPWYSGMTQGLAISYLLRYYKLTTDESILPVIKKIAFVLVQPQEKGGTISKTKEGCTWIEEYPNSKKAPQVLNGYINGLIGLYEYCTFFKDDAEAGKILNETYDCLKSSLEYYDRPTDSSYDRKGKKLPIKYLRYQIFQMKHLYEIFQDSLFDAQMRIWSVMSYDKFSKEKLLQNKSIKKPKKASKISLFTFSLPKKQKTNYIEIALNDSNLSGFETGVFLKSNNKPKNLVEIECEKLILGNQLYFTFPETNISDILIQFKNENKFSLTWSQLDFYNTTTDSIPEKYPLFAHVTTKSYELKKQVSYKIDLPHFNTEKVVVFYKYAKPGNSISKEKWKANSTINIQKKFVPEETASYRFLVVYNQSCPISAIGNFSISPEVINSESKIEM